MASPQLQPSFDFEFTREYLNRLQARDSDTIRHFHNYFALPVRNFIRHRVPYPNLDDLFQDAFVAIFQRIDAGEPREPSKFPAYVFAICRNIIKKGFRGSTETGHPPDVDPSIFPDPGERADARLLREFEASELEQARLALPNPRDREAVYRVYVIEQDRPAAARAMGLTADQLRVVLCRAVQRLAIELDKLRKRDDL